MLHVFLFLTLWNVSNDSTLNQIESYILKHTPYNWSISKKQKYSRQLASRIVIESKRRGLDPYVLTAIGRIESNYSYWTSRNGDDSHGVWQTIRSETYTRKIAFRLAKCKYDHLTIYWRNYARIFLLRYKNTGICEDQLVANYRKRTGYFSKKELKQWNNVISTYIFALEVKKHLDSARRYRYKYWIAGCGLSKIIQNRILRYSSYNTGYKKPRWYYMHRICKFYKEIRGIK